MTTATALRILGLMEGCTDDEVHHAKRRLLAAIHPDKHPTGDKDVFERLASDVNEAARVLLAGPRDATHAPRPSDDVQSVLFDIRAAESWNRAEASKGVALARFDHRFASDKILAVAILGLDPRFEWFTTSGFTGQRDDKVGTALYMVAWNRTRRRVEGLDLEKGFLIDDLGNQYSCDGSFYWADASGSFHRHSSDIAPSAKLDGFLLYPPLRGGASFFSRWFLHDSFSVADKYISGDYEIHLPAEPQRTAALLAATPANDQVDEEFRDDEPDSDDDNVDDPDGLDDDWLYGDEPPRP